MDITVGEVETINERAARRLKFSGLVMLTGKRIADLGIDYLERRDNLIGTAPKNFWIQKNSPIVVVGKLKGLESSR